METNELKFLLTLLGCANYRSTLSAKAFDSFKGKDKICRDLGDRELVDFSREIASVNILPPGQALLKLEPAQIPLVDKEHKVLEKISKASGKIIPSKIKMSSLKAADKEAILTALDERGLIEVEQKITRTKAEVWLTQRGLEYLRDDYYPKGKAIISLDLLNNYLGLLRKSLHNQPAVVPTTEEPPIVTIVNLTDEEILQTIQKLEREVGTDNYLPIFHLRQKLQTSLSRDELDKALYRLQANDKIELSSLQEANAYSLEQIDTGIPQNIGGSLFFISVN